MLNSPILSICIPSYNRDALLSEGLRAVISQMDEELCALVEIVISDNASSDDTPDLVLGLQAAHPQVQLRYSRQRETVNGNENIYHAAKLSRGTFVYIVSDDDILLPGALARITAGIQSHPAIDALCPNFGFFAGNLGDLGASVYNLSEDCLILDRDESLLTVGTMITFISSVVFRREIIADRDYADKIKTSFPHSYMFLDVLARERGCLFIKQSCMAVRSNDAVGYNLLQLFAQNFYALMKHAERLGYSEHATQMVLSAHLSFLQGCVYHFKVTGSYHPSTREIFSDMKRLLEVYQAQSFRLYKIFLIIALPLGAVQRLRKLYRSVRVCAQSLARGSDCCDVESS